MRAKAIPIYLNSAGALLLALATALFLINWTSPPDYVPPHDPIFLMPVNELFWIIGGIAMVVALFCLFSEHRTFSLLLLAWLAADFLAYRIGLFAEGCRNSTGYFGSFASAFGISPKTLNEMADIGLIYLLVGSAVTLWIARRLPPPAEFQKMACPSCGGHIRFPSERHGQKIECPRCNAGITLRKPEEMVKMSCFFCKENIEFPAHAIGRKIKCPHCKMEVGLKEKPV